ncbi:unnamed protein product [Rotaria socialis]|uniref:Symplekin n=1 Tax=Rotaria socialis TaxID=392032 RepID=A0A817Y1W7_9BILA|nr:unnamed protein product [Rotaria socialis]
MSDNIQETIVDLLNQALLYGNDSTRVKHLRHVQELILRKDPSLLNHFLEEVLSFQTDKSPEIKKTIISFIEEACQQNPKLIVKVIDSLNLLLHDDNVFVQKKLILSMMSIYKSTLAWLSKSESIDELVCSVWDMMTNIKNHIVSILNSNDDRLCTVAIKFIEMLALTLTRHEQDFSINSNANDNEILFRTKLEQEEKEMTEKLLEFILSEKLSSVNLIAAVEAVSNIARQRSDYISRILQIFEVLHVNLSSNFIDSQVSSVRKTIKLKLLNLLKYSASSSIQSQYSTLLADFGATQAEILKYSPKVVQESKRKFISNDHSENIKKSKTMNNVKLDIDQDIKQEKSVPNIIDVQRNDLLPWVSSTVDLKILSTSIDFISNSSKQQKKIKSFKLSNVLKPLEFNDIQRMSLDSFHRVLNAEVICDGHGVDQIRQKVMTRLVCLFEQSFRNIYEDYIFADVHERYDLAFIWLYQEYVYANGYLTIFDRNKKKNFTKYDNILCRLLEYFFQEKYEDLFSRLITSAPIITDNALFILKRYCQNENYSHHGMNILRSLIISRIIIREKCLNLLLILTHNEDISIRNNSLNVIQSLHEKKEFKISIEQYALKCLSYLRTLKPPEILFSDNEKLLIVSPDAWTEDSIHRCLSLYLSLISSSHHLIQPLSNIYIEVDKDIKRVILQILETPVRAMGVASLELFKLVKNCPIGAEALITHILHIHTQQMTPSRDIVENIQDLYYKRIPDVRLLIPILSGLGKCDIINTLPKFIKLPLPMVKEVFKRVLSLKDSSRTLKTNLILPSELLIALHRISLEECELKTIINATSICFNECSTYTSDILVDVLQQLVEMTPIPILFMRTVLQAFSLYPKMVHFIMNILQRLISKQAWKQPRIWEGFIKCCEKTRPHSYPILLQLPPAQLKHVLQITSELRDGLVGHIRSMSSAQHSSIPSSRSIVIEDDSENILPVSLSNSTQ